MQAERIPPKDKSEDHRLQGRQAADRHADLLKQRTAADRILGWSLLASLLVNAFFVILLSHADIFGRARNIEEVKHVRVEVYKPPIKRPPPPKPKVVPPPPPPKPRLLTKPPPTPPVVRPHVTPPPTPQRPQPPTPAAAPRAPSVGHVVHTNAPQAIAIGPTAPSAPVAAPQTPGRNTAPSAPIVAPPAPVHHEAPAPPAPAPVVHHEAPPAAPPPPRHPANWVDVDYQEADVRDIPDPDTSGIDASSISGPCTISFEISESGRISSVRVKDSSGSPEFDHACEQAIERAHGVAAVQDHIPRSQRREHTFSAG